MLFVLLLLFFYFFYLLFIINKNSSKNVLDWFQELKYELIFYKVSFAAEQFSVSKRNSVFTQKQYDSTFFFLVM